MAFLLGMITGMALLSAFAWIAARMLNEAAGHDEPRLKPNPHLRTESVDARKTG